MPSPVPGESPSWRRLRRHRRFRSAARRTPCVRLYGASRGCQRGIHHVTSWCAVCYVTCQHLRRMRRPLSVPPLPPMRPRDTHSARNWRFRSHSCRVPPVASPRYPSRSPLAPAVRPPAGIAGGAFREGMGATLAVATCLPSRGDSPARSLACRGATPWAMSCLH